MSSPAKAINVTMHTACGNTGTYTVTRTGATLTRGGIEWVDGVPELQTTEVHLKAAGLPSLTLTGDQWRELEANTLEDRFFDRYLDGEIGRHDDLNDIIASVEAESLSQP